MNTPEEIQSALNKLTQEIKAEFGGNNCAVTCSTHLTHVFWSIHAIAQGCCAIGETYEVALGRFRKEYGQKTRDQLAAELRTRADKLTKEAEALTAPQSATHAALIDIAKTGPGL